MGKAKPRKPASDIALVHGRTEDGAGAKVLRLRDGQLSAGEVRPVAEGQPVNDRELVRLKPMTQGSPVCEVEVLHGPEQASDQGGAGGRAQPSAGPARVSTDAYRRNWGQVFAKRGTRAHGKGRKKDLSLN